MPKPAWREMLPDKKIQFLTFCRLNLEGFQWDEEATEVKCICPACKGGDRYEQTFDVNVITGASRCWRADNCGVSFNATQLVSFILDMDWEKAQDFLAGDLSDPRILNGYVRHIERYIARTVVIDFEETNIFEVTVDDVEPLEGHELEAEIRDWIYLGRKYDPEEFLKHNTIVVPDQDRFYGRVAFEFYSEESLAYQLYAFKKGIFPKTLNPSDAVLSKTIYGVNDETDLPIFFLVEGIFDRERLRSYGFAAGAIFGTNLSDAQIALLERHLDERVEEVCILLDPDAYEKGKSLAEKMAKVLDRFTISVGSPPPEKDPDKMSFEDVFDSVDAREVIFSPDRRAWADKILMKLM